MILLAECICVISFDFWHIIESWLPAHLKGLVQYDLEWHSWHLVYILYVFHFIWCLNLLLNITVFKFRYMQRGTVFHNCANLIKQSYVPNLDQSIPNHKTSHTLTLLLPTSYTSINTTQREPKASSLRPLWVTLSGCIYIYIYTWRWIRLTSWWLNSAENLKDSQLVTMGAGKFQLDLNLSSNV